MINLEKNNKYLLNKQIIEEKERDLESARVTDGYFFSSITFSRIIARHPV